MDIFSQTWWHGSRQPLKTIDFTHVQGGLHLGTKRQAAQFGPHQHSFTISPNARIRKSKDTGDGWKKKAHNARKAGVDILLYLNRIEGIDPRRFDAFDHDKLNTMPDTAFKKLFPEADYSLLVLREGILK